MGPLVMAPRERISKKRVTGQLIQWKGKYGWIRPSEPIQHPDAVKRGGKVYVGVEDIEGPELATKDMVTFFPYVDGDGLGAMHCRAAPGVARPDKGGGKGKERPQPVEEAGGEEEERTPPPPPDQSARERVLAERITGKLVRWRGQMGWIKPKEKVDHPEVAKHRKGIYLHEVDVQPGQELVQGAIVSFFVYSDADGLGAEDCMLIEKPPEDGEEVAAMDVEPDSAPKAPSKGGSKGALDAARKKGAPQKGVAVKGAALKGVALKGMAQKGEAQKSMVQKLQLKRRRSGKRGQGPRDGTKPGGGPDLPRERVTTTPVTGEVLDWKGSYGWVSCSEEIEHEMLTKHDGKIYLHEKDILDGSPLSVGKLVEFHIYSDESGLGAEEAIATAS